MLSSIDSKTSADAAHQVFVTRGSNGYYFITCSLPLILSSIKGADFIGSAHSSSRPEGEAYIYTKGVKVVS